MIWIAVRKTARKRSLDLPANVAHRSVDGGTLILIPGQTREITEDEWSHICASHPDVATSIDVLRR